MTSQNVLRNRKHNDLNNNSNIEVGGKLKSQNNLNKFGKSNESFGTEINFSLNKKELNPYPKTEILNENDDSSSNIIYSNKIPNKKNTNDQNSISSISSTIPKRNIIYPTFLTSTNGIKLFQDFEIDPSSRNYPINYTTNLKDQSNTNESVINQNNSNVLKKTTKKPILWEYNLNIKIYKQEHINQILKCLDFLENQTLITEIKDMIEKHFEISSIKPIYLKSNSKSIENIIEDTEESIKKQIQNKNQQNIDNIKNYINFTHKQWLSLLSAQNKLIFKRTLENVENDDDEIIPLWKISLDSQLEFQGERKIQEKKSVITLSEYKKMTKEFKPSKAHRSPFGTLAGNSKIGINLIVTIITMALAFGFVAHFYFQLSLNLVYSATGIGAIVGLIVDGILIVIQGSKFEAMETKKTKQFSKSMPGVQRGHVIISNNQKI